MKKLLIMSLAALGLALVPTHRADAWINFKFSAGVNWQWQSGGNNFLWGAFRNGAPGQEAYGPGFPAGPAYAAPAPFYAPAPTQAPPGGGAPPKKEEEQTRAQQAYGDALNYYGANPYQTTSYSHYPLANYSNTYAPATGYYQPGYYYQVPSYWYGR